MNHVRRSAASFLVAALALAQPAVADPAAAGEGLVLASDSGAFDRACERYYQQGNDPEVPDFAAYNFCECLALKYGEAGLGIDALEFFARTYSDDLTTFIHEYPDGEAWMEQSFQTDVMCKTG